MRYIEKLAVFLIALGIVAIALFVKGFVLSAGALMAFRFLYNW